MPGHSSDTPAAPADPSVPPSLALDARVTGSALLPSQRQPNNADMPTPEKMDPEDAKLDQQIKSICRGC